VDQGAFLIVSPQRHFGKLSSGLGSCHGLRACSSASRGHNYPGLKCYSDGWPRRCLSPTFQRFYKIIMFELLSLFREPTNGFVRGRRIDQILGKIVRIGQTKQLTAVKRDPTCNGLSRPTVLRGWERARPPKQTGGILRQMRARRCAPIRNTPARSRFKSS
jgi:hypothetical protein